MFASHKRELLYIVSYVDQKMTVYSVEMKNLASKKKLFTFDCQEKPHGFQINSSETFFGFLLTEDNLSKLQLVNLNSFSHRRLNNFFFEKKF